MKLGRCALVFALAAALHAAPRIKRIQLSVTNPVPQARTENVVLAVGQLKRIDPAFNAGNAIVVASNAASFADDARVLQAAELPSQADDLDGDGKYDELAFQIDLAAGQTRIVTLAYGDQAAIQRLRGKYPVRTAMKFATRYEGLGWESEDIAWASTSTSAMPSISTASAGPASISTCSPRPSMSTTWKAPWAATFSRWTPPSASDL
jgi:hypothetical protein